MEHAIACRRVLSLLWLFVLLPCDLAAQRRLAVIVDTSRSMLKSDRERYAAQIAKILTDLVADGDQLQVLRMPSDDKAISNKAGLSIEDLKAILRGRAPNLGLQENCSASPDPSIMVSLRGADRPSFKSAIDRLLVDDTGTYFAQPVHAAISFLTTNRSQERLLLFLADSGGFETNCAGQLTRELSALRSTGAQVSLVNLGSSAGSFSGNPAFDSTASASNSEELIRAVAQIYQRFLGGKKVQTGSISGSITVQIDPYVKEAFLVAAAEDSLQPLTPAGGSPPAGRTDTDYRGGGSTADLDGHPRGYRIVRLENPSPGSWTFLAPQGTRGGWMLVQEYAIGLRALPVQPVAAGASARITFEAVDERSGQRITDPAVLGAMAVSVNLDGRQLSAARQSDGTFQAEHSFAKEGKYNVEARVTSAVTDRRIPVRIEVAAGGWKVVPTLSTQEIYQRRSVEIRAKLERTGQVPVAPPDRVFVEVSGKRLPMTPAGDGTYTAAWTPESIGKTSISVHAEGGLHVEDGSIEVDVRTPPVTSPPQPAAPPAPPEPPRPTPNTSATVATPAAPTIPPPAPAVPGLRLGAGHPVDVGKLRSGSVAEGKFRLTGATIPRDTDVVLRSNWRKRGASLEVRTNQGWVPISSSGVRLRLSASGQNEWPIRLRVESCPAACAPNEQHAIILAATRADGTQEESIFPLTAEISKDPWLRCYWPYLAAAATVVVIAFVLCGFLWPYSFEKRLGVQVSPDLDLSEGAYMSLKFHRSGFYRHARAFLASNFTLNRKPSAAICSLRAGKRRTYISPCNGQSIWRQRLDGEWERLPAGESIARDGTLHRNDDASLYFELRYR